MLNGEATYTAWLAEKNKLKHESPEPSEHTQREILQSMGYSKDEIQYYFIYGCSHAFIQEPIINQL